MKPKRQSRMYIPQKVDTQKRRNNTHNRSLKLKDEQHRPHHTTLGVVVNGNPPIVLPIQSCPVKLFIFFILRALNIINQI